MTEKDYICFRCKKKICRTVECCTVCLRDFHPRCSNSTVHKIFDKENKLVSCPGPFEIFNLKTSGKKEFKRRRTISNNYDAEELVNATLDLNENNNLNILFSNSDNTNFISVGSVNDGQDQDTSDCSIQFEGAVSKLNEKIEQINVKNLQVMKTHIKNCIKEEILGLRSVIKDVIIDEIRKITAVWKSEFTNLKS